MYTSFFGLNEKPFSITPNPRYLYMSERHTEGLAHLIYGIKDSSGFIQLTGEVGTGKTTLIRSLLQRLPDNADVALILNPQLSATEFLTSILTELHIEVPDDVDSLKTLTDTLNQFLLENHSKGQRTILIVDEAQNFAVDVLEQIRLLTNLETSHQKLLQITLIGQPELRAMLARTDLRQLAQRITGRYHLQPLSQEDTEQYIRHRMRVAGATREIFNSGACRELYRLSGGVPRIINVIADRALLGAFTQDEHDIGPALIRKAAREVYGNESGANGRRKMLLRVAALVCAAAALIGIATFVAGRYAGVPVLQADSASQESSMPSVAEDIEAQPAAPAVVATPEADREQPAPVAEPIAVQANVLEETIRSNPNLTDAKSAFSSLFTLWGAEFDTSKSRACDYAQEFQLYCLFQKGSLAQVQRLDRPVILTLRDSEGGLHQVVLAQIDQSSAVIDVGSEKLKVPLNDVIELWYGEYLLLWQPQIGAVKSFYPGLRDPDVTWLRESLATIQGNPIDPMDSEYFDDNLESRVKDYQVTRRLNVDGLVGQQTQIVINSDLGVGAPRLVKAD